MKSIQNNLKPQTESAAATETTNATGKLLFDVREAAARLSISVVSVRKLIRQNRLKRVPDFRKVLKAIGAKLAVPHETVEMFNASTFTISPYSTGILTFSREIQLSPHSALMGGQLLFSIDMPNRAETNSKFLQKLSLLVFWVWSKMGEINERTTEYACCDNYCRHPGHYCGRDPGNHRVRDWRFQQARDPAQPL